MPGCRPAPPARRDGFDHLQCGLLAADRVKGGIEAEPFCHLPHSFDNVPRARIDRVRRAKIRCIAQLGIAQIAGDDRVCPGQRCALDDVEPDAAAPDHQHAGASREPRVADHRADPGSDATADDCGLGERQVVAHFDDLLGGTDDLLRERLDARHLVDRLAVQLNGGRPVMHAPARRAVVSDARTAARRSNTGNGRNAAGTRR